MEEPQVNGDGSAGTALLGLPGFVLLAVSEFDGEFKQAVDDRAASMVRRLRASRKGAAWCGCGMPSAGAPGDAGVGEAAVAVRGAGVSGGHLVGDLRAGPAAGVADRADPAEACRLVGQDGWTSRRGGAVWGGLGHRHAGCA